MGTGQILQKSKVYKDVELSNFALAFNLMDDQQSEEYKFNMNHMSSSYKEWEDGFIIINLLSVSTLHQRCLGEVVFQVGTILKSKTQFLLKETSA